ncbi:MAG TPA: prolyl oligopeptidase family serine peptidase, partial [Marmoricola sp.]
MTDPTTPSAPPVAPREPFEHTQHGVRRADPYHWMSTPSPVLTDHLVAERAFYDVCTGHLHGLASHLASDMGARIPGTERSASWNRSRFSYYSECASGNDYGRIYREIRGNDTFSQQNPSRSQDVDNGIHGSRELVLDVPGLADDSGYLELGVTLVSPDEDRLAYSVDRTGEEVYELHFRDLTTGVDLDDVVPRTYYGGAWSADSTTFFYTVHDEVYRPHQVWRHRIGTPVEEDVLVLSEPDQRFELHLRATRSNEAVLILSESRDTSESWVVDARRPESPPRSVGGRRPGVIYRAEHVRESDDLLVVTNDDAVEFRIVRAPLPRDADQDHTTWTEVRPEDPAERLERVDAFADHVVLSLRSEGEHRLRVLHHDDLAGPGHVLRTRHPGGGVRIARTPAYDAAAVTIVDQAHVEPPTWWSVDLATATATEVHRAEAPGHDAARYVTTRMTFPAPDGTPVPATVVRHRDTPLDGTAPALLYAYGAYEYTFEPDWDPALPTLLDRGVVYVHAHVRGGGEGGRRWWLQGRLEHKQNTFTDLVAVADGLAGRYVDGDNLTTRGLSAGGLLQGVVFSQRPERWRAVVAEVPFVDVVTTM